MMGLMKDSAHRQQHLQRWLHRYNWHRPHTALKLKTPVQSLNLATNNVLRLHWQRLCNLLFIGAPCDIRLRTLPMREYLKQQTAENKL